MAEVRAVEIVEIELDRKRHLVFNLNALVLAQERLSERRKREVDITEVLASGKLKIDEIRAVVWAALVHEDPELTEEQVGRMIDVNNIAYVGQKIGEAFKAQGVPEEGPQRGPFSG